MASPNGTMEDMLVEHCANMLLQNLPQPEVLEVSGGMKRVAKSSPSSAPSGRAGREGLFVCKKCRLRLFTFMDCNARALGQLTA